MWHLWCKATRELFLTLMHDWSQGKGSYPSYMKRILNLLWVKNITLKSSYNWFKYWQWQMPFYFFEPFPYPISFLKHIRLFCPCIIQDYCGSTSSWIIFVKICDVVSNISSKPIASAENFPRFSARGEPVNIPADTWSLLSYFLVLCYPWFWFIWFW